MSKHSVQLRSDKWCRHIKWHFFTDCTIKRMILGKIYRDGGIEPPASWKYCPICGAARPKNT